MTADWCRGSEDEGEFGERRRELVTRVGVGGDVVVAAAQVLHERVPGTDHAHCPAILT